MLETRGRVVASKLTLFIALYYCCFIAFVEKRRIEISQINAMCKYMYGHLLYTLGPFWNQDLRHEFRTRLGTDVKFNRTMLCDHIC